MTGKVYRTNRYSRRKEETVIHERLRLAREKKGWTIEELARRTGIRPRTIELIDRGQLAELPAGLYGRSSIRGYAAAVGLDAGEILDAVRPLLASAEDPLDGLARRCGHSRKAEPRVEEAPPAAPDPAEVTIAFEAGPLPEDEATASPAFPAAPRLWRPLAASVIDGTILASLGFTLVWLTAVACATTVPAVLRSGGAGIAVVFALIVALYFVLFGGVGDATPGVRAMRLEPQAPGRTVLSARDVFGRACRAVRILHTAS
jgi:transcriptional regulator with XRE-family HTH domain